MKSRAKAQKTIDEILKEHWGYDSFRPMQQDVIQSVMSGKDTLVLMPTGGGKSLTYQVPALAMNGTTIVITPLIALMNDQVYRLRQLGIKALAIHSGLSPSSIINAIDLCQFGDVKLLYVAPERLTSESFIRRVAGLKVSFIAVDEAHCISQWGYDFRPSYLCIGEFRERFPDVPILALTASATKRVCRDIMRRLNFKERKVMMGDFSRPNLSYVVRRCEDKRGMLERLLTSVDGAAIVYSRTRAESEAVAQIVEEMGVSATFYHGGLPYAERNIRQDEWMRGEKRVICATNAFGMGIDRSDVRLVVHYSMCASIEAYYQEAGRAGRDGERSYAVLLYSNNDMERIETIIDKSFPTLDFIKECYDKICASLMIGYGEGEGVNFPFNLREICVREGWWSDSVLSVIKILSICGYLSYDEQSESPARVFFTVSRDDLYRVRINRPDLEQIILLLLRNYEGIFSDFRVIDEEWLAQRGGYTTERIRELLALLWRSGVIRYIPSQRTALLRMGSARVPVRDLYISPEVYKFRRDLYFKRFADMNCYTLNESRCRARMLVEYFSVDSGEDCGICDICIERRKAARGE
ncbi:MAG: ATP-dependent DNA helicase RecQ [Rikenellaceae bacterium]